jgi:predicted nucleotidyltransferase
MTLCSRRVEVILNFAMDTYDEVEARRREAAQILNRLRGVLPSVLTEYPVDVAYVYGSVVRGTVTPFSDVDVALVLSESFPPYERLNLEFEIEAAIEDATGLTGLDVRAINEAPLLVRGKIVQEGVRLYECEHARRVAFEVYTRKRYFDFAPVARRLQAAFLDKIHREGLLHG